MQRISQIVVYELHGNEEAAVQAARMLGNYKVGAHGCHFRGVLLKPLSLWFSVLAWLKPQPFPNRASVLWLL